MDDGGSVQTRIEANRHLVGITASMVISRLPNSGRFEMDDLIGAGNLGLVKAAQKFDPARGVKFGTFAIALIRGAMLDYVRENDVLKRVHRQQVRDGQCDDVSVVSLEVVLSNAESETLTLGDRLTDPSPGLLEVATASVSRDVLQQAVAWLPAREREAVRLYYGAERTYKQIGEIQGISESRSHQLVKQAVGRLAQYLDGQQELFA